MGRTPANWPSSNGAPCKVFEKSAGRGRRLGKLQPVLQVRAEHMMYFTWSEGYRPGGINRRGTLPPYITDFLTNYEIGWKTSWPTTR
jgi:iron complex outermembrane receptor protein